VTKNYKNLINAMALLFEWSAIVVIIYINQFSQPIWFSIVSVILIGTRIHALGILMHEASHFNLFTNRTWNDLITKIFITTPFFVSLDAYRKSHQLHHQYSLTEKDPTHTRKSGVPVFAFPKKAPRSLAWELIKITLGYGVYLTICDLVRNRRQRSKKKSRLKSSLNIIIASAVLFYFLRSPFQNLFIIFWLLPTLTILPVLNYWRTISEHSAVNAVEPTRSVVYGPILKWLLTPYNVNYHLEHHLFPKKSWFKLYRLSSLEKKQLAVGHTTYGFLNLWKEFVQ
jgi:fatty acid desaturase